jgi:hypothetical protein
MEYFYVKGKLVINKSCDSNVAAWCQFVRPLPVVDVSPAAGVACPQSPLWAPSSLSSYHLRNCAAALKAAQEALADVFCIVVSSSRLHSRILLLNQSHFKLFALNRSQILE